METAVSGRQAADGATGRRKTITRINGERFYLKYHRNDRRVTESAAVIFFVLRFLLVLCFTRVLHPLS